MKGWKQLIHQLSTEDPKTNNPSFEYAFGNTPIYSLSKALVNSYTKLLQQEYQSIKSRIRVISICPGNFESPMTTPGYQVY
jgi:NAD(P)-dependent dehydrogenase (short-subunit alcohol dehydrogenase family)